jgi:hemolysin III
VSDRLRFPDLTVVWRVKEPFSCFSHLLGVLLAVPGLVWLVLQSHGEPWRTVGFSIYGASLILLYSASTLYHWLPLSPRKEDLLRRFDHVAIYLLIAGTYTPVCLVTLRGGWGWSLFVVVWGLALAGSAVKLFFRHLPRWLTTALYVGMGWMAVIAFVPLLQTLPVAAFNWLLAGGIFYTLGALIYAAQRPDPFPDVFGFHDIFHVFVLAGSFFHFVFMLRYVLPTA